MHHQGNEEELYGYEGTDENNAWNKKYNISSVAEEDDTDLATTKRKKRRNSASPSANFTPTSDAKVLKASNTVFHNVIQYVKRHIADSVNFIGGWLVEHSRNLIDNMHGDETYRKYETIPEGIPFAAMPSDHFEFLSLMSGSVDLKSASYEKYCVFETTTKNMGKSVSELFNLMPTRFNENGMISTDTGICLDFKVSQNANNDFVLRMPKVEFDSTKTMIIGGGGPFIQFLANGVRIANVIAIPFQFIMMALTEEGGDSDYMPNHDEYPFKDVTEEEFRDFNYSNNVWTFQSKTNYEFFNEEFAHNNPFAFNALLEQYFRFQLNEILGEKTPEELQEAEEDVQAAQMMSMSLGNFLLKIVDELRTIFEHKVYTKNSLVHWIITTLLTQIHKNST